MTGKARLDLMEQLRSLRHHDSSSERYAIRHGGNVWREHGTELRAALMNPAVLSREVAEAMNIQLIYTTAIKDFEALHVFPNIIRIRNDQLDRRTGYHLMMHDTSPEGLEAIRIMHSESRDFSREHQDHQS